MGPRFFCPSFDSGAMMVVCTRTRRAEHSIKYAIYSTYTVSVGSGLMMYYHLI